MYWINQLRTPAIVTIDRINDFIDKTKVESTSLKARIGGLDELRGLSILWVMLCHGTVIFTWIPHPFMGYGFHGVVLFFIVSGYLITKILIQTAENREPLSNFYVRRALRIWPLMLIALLFGAYLMPKYANSIAYNLVFINNFSMGFGIEPVFRTDVMWSLAIEEQFYLLWPLIVYLIGKKIIPTIIGMIIFLGFSFDAQLLPTMSGIPTFKATYGCMQYIALGAAIALGRAGLIAALAAIGGFLVFFYTREGSAFFVHLRYIWWGITIFLFFFVYFTVHVRPLIHSRFLAFSGRLCYGLYIIHFFCSWTVYNYLGSGIIIPGFIYFASSFAISILSFYVIEKPALRLRSWIEPSEQIKLALLIAVIVTALCSLAAIVSRVPPL